LCLVAIDPKYEKYFKMKKMLPEGAVRQKMMQEGCSDAEIEALFNGTLGAAAPTPAATAAPGNFYLPVLLLSVNGSFLLLSLP
jgi:hypothetical protein